MSAAGRLSMASVVLLSGAWLGGAATAGAASDVSAPYGAFGFSSRGLGDTSNYGEPSLAIAPDGHHILVSTPGGGGVQYWYSDGGTSWAHTSTTCGGGDSALDFLPDGTAVSADLNFPGSPSNPADSCVSISHEFGTTWSAFSRAGIEQDRQWLAHSPDSKRLFLAYHDFIAEAEFISESDDGGATWTTLPTNQTIVNSPDQVTATPLVAGATPGSSASILDQGVNTFSGPMLIDPNGKDYYVVYSISDLQSNLNPQDGVPPFGPVRALVLAHSSDAGSTWTNHLADVAQISGTSESIENTLFPWGFIDSAGTVYIVFDSTRDGAPGDHFHQYYIYSKDKGTTWSAPVKIDGLPLGTGAAAYATGDAVSPGVIDMAWYQSDDGTPSNDSSTWVPHFAQVTGADTAHPTVLQQAITTVPNHHGGICLQGILCGIGPGSADRSLADFFQLKVNPVSKLAYVAYADNYRLGPGHGEVVVAAQTLFPGASTGATVPSTGGSATQATAPAPIATPNTAPASPGAAALAAGALLLGARLAARTRRPKRSSSRTRTDGTSAPARGLGAGARTGR